MTISKPMLAGKCSDITKLRYPVLATPKLDGIRCLIIDEPLAPGAKRHPRAVSRNFKPIPNYYVRRWLEQNCPVGFDGELVVPGGTFQQTSSAIMSRNGEPEFEYQVFDWVGEEVSEPYQERTDFLRDWEHLCKDHLKLVLPNYIKNVDDLQDYERYCLEAGYEGIMLRTPDSPYKCGRSTEREGYLLKLKRFEDGEAIITGFEEKTKNSGETFQDELGRPKRHKYKAEQVPMNTLGALIVKDLSTGIQFRIGTGFDEDTRKLFWEVRDQLLGKIVRYKSQPSGVKDAPRFPVFLGIRSSLP